jgi:hypothetical protein
MNLNQLKALGFDQSQQRTGSVRVACSQCEAMVIQGTPCHESGCPNALHECAGCNELVPMRVKYCAECQ